MDALGVATIGLVLSVASLTWQGATFVMSGARVRANLRIGAMGRGGVASGPPGRAADFDLRQMAAQGFTQQVIGVEALNVGRLAVQVTGIQVVLANGVKVGALQGTVGPDLPHRLEAQSAGSWFVPADPVRHAVAASAAALKGKDPCECWVEVQLGNGRTIKTKERMMLGSSS